jgi:hypothetical protein
MRDFFNSFTVEKPEFQLLGTGEHELRITRVEFVNSFEKYNHQPKDKEFEWKDAVPQMAVTVVAAEKGKSGGLTHRFNGLGYMKWDDPEITDKMRKTALNKSGYYCITDEEGDIVRVPSEKRSQQCKNIMNQFALALGIKEGDNLIEGINDAIANQKTFRATVINDPYMGKDQLKLAGFKASAKVSAGDDGDDTGEYSA